MNMNVLTTTLSAFVTAFSAGHSRLMPYIKALLVSLTIVDLVLFGAWWALGENNRISHGVRKLLFLGFWAWLVLSFPTLAKSFVESLIYAGLVAGGRSGADHSLLLDPSAIASMGLAATEQLANAINEVGWDFGDAMIFGFAYVVIMLAHLLMALQVFLAVVEYYMLLALVGILLPFGVLSQTKFLAEKAIGAMVAAGIKLMALAFLLAVVTPVLSKIRFAGAEIQLNELWVVLFVSCILAYLIWQAPSFAAGLLAGAPSLSAGSMAQNVAAGAMMAAPGIAAAAAAARAGMKAASWGKSAADSAIRAMRSTGGGSSGGGGGGGGSATSAPGSPTSSTAAPRAGTTTSSAAPTSGAATATTAPTWAAEATRSLAKADDVVGPRSSTSTSPSTFGASTISAPPLRSGHTSTTSPARSAQSRPGQEPPRSAGTSSSSSAPTAPAPDRNPVAHPGRPPRDGR